MSLSTPTLGRRRLRARELLGLTDNSHPIVTLTFRAGWQVLVHLTALPLVDLAIVAAVAPTPGRYYAVGALVAVTVSFIATGNLDTLVDWHHARWVAAHTIRASWAFTMAANGLAKNGDIPGLRRAKARRGAVILTVRYANGQALADWQAQIDSLTARWGATHLEIAPHPRPTRLLLTVGVRDFLDRSRSHPWDD